MRFQRLTSLDIKILAAELDRLFAGKVISNIIIKQNDVFISVNDYTLCYLVFSSIPYLSRSIDPVAGRRWLTDILNGKVEKVGQVKNDRLILFDITVFDRLGRKKSFHLYFELFQNGDIVLTDEKDEILRTLRKRQGRETRYKVNKPRGFDVLAGDEHYLPSAQEKDFIRSLNLLQYSLHNEVIPDNIMKYIIDIQKNPAPHLIKNADAEVCGFSVYGPPFRDKFSGEKKDSLLDAITCYVESVVGDHRDSVTRSAQMRNLKKLTLKANHKLKAIQAELEQAKNFKHLRFYGEIIMANMHNLKKGKKLVLLPNPYSSHHELIEIPLNPALTPEENAEAYFTKARKLEASIRILEERLEKQKKEIEKIRRLSESGAPAQPGKKAESPTKAPAKLPFRKFTLEGGWLIFVGKSASSNDELTFSFARKDDFWFHAWQAAGSHVVLRRPQKKAIPDKKTLLKAASLAAYFSRAKTSSKVPVIYTQVRYVRKIKKAAGKVSVTGEKQLMVKPAGPATINGIKKPTL